MVDYLLYLYAETPIHAGADSGEGVIDDPIQRETATSYPVIWGQSLKGALRERATAHFDAPDVTSLFGTAVNDPADKERGAVSVGDAQIVAFPVATVVHTFAWATSELALSRLQRKRALARLGTQPLPARRAPALAPHGADWSATREIFGNSVVPVTVEPEHGPLGGWANRLADEGLPADDAFRPFREKLRRDLVALGDTAFTDAVIRGTELTPRIALEPHKKTVKDGALFHVEYLPTESLLAATLTVRDGEASAKRKLEELLAADGPPLQLGGDETVGKGVLWATLVSSRSLS